LQIGSPLWQADKILLTLDVTSTVIEYAISKQIELIISHHPLIFRPIHSVTRPDILQLTTHKIGVLTLHTNLDVVSGGVNTALAEVLGLQMTSWLSPETGSTWYHGSVTVPPLHLEKVSAALQAAGAGKIGLYDSCSTQHPVSGTFRALAGSLPYAGEPGKYEKVDEIELEFMVDSFHLQAVKQAIAKAHPYETPALFFVQTENPNPAYGLGIIGELSAGMTLTDFASFVKNQLSAPFVQLWTAGKEPGNLVKKIAICGGAGGSLIGKATGQADVLVTGDINYHAMLDSRIPLINAGHFFTEYPALAKLQTYLAAGSITAEIFPATQHEVNQNIMI
jgi:dinuclear metal center YbgI/SA1388 family protein